MDHNGTMAGQSISPIALTDHVAVVTGSAQGLGEAIATGFARAGAAVAICDRQADKLERVAGSLRAAGGDVLASVLDVRDPQSVGAFVGEVGVRWGRVDTLVNNAGGGFVSPFLDVSAKGEAALIAENFTSATCFIRNVVPLMHRGGSIINLTSVEAFRASPGFAIYGAMKAALEQLTKTLALELAPRQIRVNCISPDAIPSVGEEDLSGTFGAGFYDSYVERLPLGRGEPADVANAVLFLASPMSKFLTGDSMHLDGGSFAAAGWSRQPDGTYLP